MPQKNQPQRQMLSPFTIVPTNPNPAANPGTASQNPGGAEPEAATLGGTPQVFVGPSQTPGTVQPAFATPQHQAGGSVVHPAFAGQGASPEVAASQQRSVQPSGATPQPPTTQPGATSPGSLGSAQPGIASAIGQPSFAGSLAQQGIQANVGVPRTAGPTGGQAAVRTPPMTVFDEGESLVIEFEIPGVSKEDIELVGRQNGVVLKAAAEAPTEEGDVLAAEGAQRVYQREVPLDLDIVADDVSATFEDGILTVTLPKAEPTAGPNPIEIQ